jgi:hypothetical protein
MVGSAAAALACARAVDAGRRTAKGTRAGCPGGWDGIRWRSGATERVQASAGVAEPAIYYGRAAPVTPSITEYSDVVAQTKRRLRRAPPKTTLATVSGMRTLPSRAPSGW